MPGRSRRWFIAAATAASAALAGAAVHRRRRHGSSGDQTSLDREREAVVDALLPAGSELPGALEAGVAGYLEQALGETRFARVHTLIADGVHRIGELAQARHGRPFHELNQAARGSLLDAASAAHDGFDWRRFHDALVDFVLEGYLGHPARGGNAGGRVWTAAEVPLPARASPSASDLYQVTRARAKADVLAQVSRQHWDAVVVGSGAGGGVLAHRLAQAGFRVLVLEKGPRLPARALIPDEIGSCLRDAFVPHVADDPHLLADDAGTRRSFQGWTSCCVGGGTVHMAAMLYRMHPEDFEAATRFGIPAGSTLSDWPIGYGELRPFYDRIQDFLGLSGETGANPFEPPAAPYPGAPLGAHPAAASLDRAAAALGLHPFPTPRGILTAPRGERAACVQCGYCGAYACPVGAKASTVDTFLAAAESTGRCRVLPGAAAVEVVEDGSGRVRAVVAQDDGGGRHEIAARWIVLAASAVETARLLLLSISARSPSGLGNAWGQVGRNLVLSLEAAGRASFPYPSPLFSRADDGRPFLNRSIQDRYVDAGAAGPYPKLGTLVFDRAHFNPIQRARRAAAGVGAHGALTARLSQVLLHQREIAYESFVEMLPRSGARVRLADGVTDAAGRPVARIDVDDFPSERERTARMAAVAGEVLAALHPIAIEHDPLPGRTYFLQAGTCRMGRAPSSSVCDPQGRVHGVEGLVICDGSVLPSMGGVPPTLTIMANALRIAELMLAEP